MKMKAVKLSEIQMPDFFIEAVKKLLGTSFYEEYVEKIYFCKEEPDIIYIKNKKVYTKFEEKRCQEEVGNEVIVYDLEYLERGPSGRFIVEIMEIIVDV